MEGRRQTSRAELARVCVVSDPLLRCAALPTIHRLLKSGAIHRLSESGGCRSDQRLDCDGTIPINGSVEATRNWSGHMKERTHLADNRSNRPASWYHPALRDDLTQGDTHA